MSGPLDDPVLRLKKEEDKVGMLRHQHMQEEDEQLQDDNEQNNNNDVLQRMIALWESADRRQQREHDMIL